MTFALAVLTLDPCALSEKTCSKGIRLRRSGLVAERESGWYPGRSHEKVDSVRKKLDRVRGYGVGAGRLSQHGSRKKGVG